MKVPTHLDDAWEAGVLRLLQRYEHCLSVHRGALGVNHLVLQVVQGNHIRDVHIRIGKGTARELEADVVAGTQNTVGLTQKSLQDKLPIDLLTVVKVMFFKVNVHLFSPF